MRAVQFESFGGPEVLALVEVAEPHAAAGQIRVSRQGRRRQPRRLEGSARG
jgi:NADPH:quinone reductase-like Zn-dependent oxidoreductase